MLNDHTLARAQALSDVAVMLHTFADQIASGAVEVPGPAARECDCDDEEDRDERCFVCGPGNLAAHLVDSHGHWQIVCDFCAYKTQFLNPWPCHSEAEAWKRWEIESYAATPLEPTLPASDGEDDAVAEVGPWYDKYVVTQLALDRLRREAVRCCNIAELHSSPIKVGEQLDKIRTLCQPDGEDEVVHGVNCDCGDSCLEYSCRCGFSESNSELFTSCPDCGADMRPDGWSWAQTASAVKFLRSQCGFVSTELHQEPDEEDSDRCVCGAEIREGGCINRNKVMGPHTGQPDDEPTVPWSEVKAELGLDEPTVDSRVLWREIFADTPRVEDDPPQPCETFGHDPKEKQ